jgi:hypothetical protein
LSTGRSNSVAAGATPTHRAGAEKRSMMHRFWGPTAATGYLSTGQEDQHAALNEPPPVPAEELDAGPHTGSIGTTPLREGPALGNRLMPKPRSALPSGFFQNSTDASALCRPRL